MKIFTFFVLLCALAACGGGTTGTSSTGTTQYALRIRGSVLESNGSPVAGASVGVAGSGETVATDQNGSFEFDALTATDFSLALTSNGKTLEVDVPTVTPDTTLVTVDAVLSPDGDSAQIVSLDGAVSVSEDCRPYAVSSGNSVRMTLPYGNQQCYLNYSFHSNVQLGMATIDVPSSNCAGFSVSTNGSQQAGSSVSVFQTLNTGPISRPCEAQVRVSFPQLRTPSVFTIRLAVDAQATDDINYSYEGSLSEYRNSDSTAGCERFRDRKVFIRYTLKDSKIRVRIPSESLDLQESATATRFGIYTELENKSHVQVVPLSDLGDEKAAFILTYTTSDDSCTRYFRGQLTKQ